MYCRYCGTIKKCKCEALARMGALLIQNRFLNWLKSVKVEETKLKK